MGKKIVRLKLTDFINTNIEDNVVNFLHMMKENVPTFIVHCWYNNSELNKIELDKFKSKHSESIELIEMSFYTLNSHEHAVWYDIISNKDSDKLSHFKFRSTYENADEMIDCILEFNKVIKFDSQKNSGYNKNGFNKNAKGSNNRFKKMGK